MQCFSSCHFEYKNTTFKTGEMHPHVISVGAHDINEKAIDNNEYDVRCPGQGILSTSNDSK